MFCGDPIPTKEAQVGGIDHRVNDHHAVDHKGRSEKRPGEAPQVIIGRFAGFCLLRRK